MSEVPLYTGSLITPPTHSSGIFFFHSLAKTNTTKNVFEAILQNLLPANEREIAFPR